MLFRSVEARSMTPLTEPCQPGPSPWSQRLDFCPCSALRPVWRFAAHRTPRPAPPAPADPAACAAECPAPRTTRMMTLSPERVFRSRWPWALAAQPPAAPRPRHQGPLSTSEKAISPATGIPSCVLRLRARPPTRRRDPPQAPRPPAGRQPCPPANDDARPSAPERRTGGFHSRQTVATLHMLYHHDTVSRILPQRRTSIDQVHSTVSRPSRPG